MAGRIASVWIAVVPIVLNGCTDRIRLDRPDTGGALTEVLMIGQRSAGRPDRIFVVGANDVLPAFDLADANHAELVHLEQPPDRLGLRTGEVQLIKGTAPIDALLFQAELDGPRPIEWHEDGQWLEHVLLPEIRLDDCWRSGGCIDDGRCRTCAPVAVRRPDLPVSHPPTCPSAWTHLERDGVEYCSPWATGRPPTCSPGESTFIDAPGCAPIGTECAAPGEWPDVTGPAIFVSADVTAGGDGSRTNPFSTLDEALAVSTPTTPIVLAAGDHVVPSLRLDVDAVIRGACAATTIISGMFTVDAHVRFLDVTIADGPLIVDRDAHVILENVFIDAMNDGIRSIGRVTATRVDVRSANAEAFVMTAGSTLTADALTIRAPSSRGIYADGAHLVLTHVSFAGPRVALFAQDSSVTMTQVAAIDCENSCVTFGAGSNADLETLYVSGTRQSAAIRTSSQSRLEVSNAWLLDNAQSDVLIEDSVALIRSIVVLGLGSAVTPGVVFRTVGDTSLRLSDVRVVGVNRRVIYSSAAVLEVTDLSIDEASHEEAAITIIRGAQRAVFARTRVRRSGRVFELKSGEVEIEDLIIEEPAASECVEDPVIELGSDPIVLSSVDIQARGGPAIGVTDGIDGTRTMVLTDVKIERSRNDPCAETPALHLPTTNTFTLQRFDISHTGGLAVSVANPNATLEDGRIHDSSIGMRVNAPGELDPVIRRVAFIDNETNVFTNSD